MCKKQTNKQTKHCIIEGESIVIEPSEWRG